MSCMYNFLAILYYMGIVKLPCKRDYWSNDPLMPNHPVIHQSGISRNRFEFLWSTFHLNCNEECTMEDELEGEDEQKDNDNETLVTATVERVQKEQDEENHEYLPQDNDVEVWFEKIKPLVDHVRDVSFSMVFILGTLLSLDKMMIRFFGRCAETHKMKNIPISCGHKFSVLAIVSGFVINFTPDGHTAEKNGLKNMERMVRKEK